jgi:hypothetical protein
MVPQLVLSGYKSIVQDQLLSILKYTQKEERKYLFNYLFIYY